MRITDGNYVRILEEDKGEYGSQVIYTITCAGDAVGAVVILDKPGERKFSDTEEKLPRLLQDFWEDRWNSKKTVPAGRGMFETNNILTYAWPKVRQKQEKCEI